MSEKFVSKYQKNKLKNSLEFELKLNIISLKFC